MRPISFATFWDESTILQRTSDTSSTSADPRASRSRQAITIHDNDKHRGRTSANATLTDHSKNPTVILTQNSTRRSVMKKIGIVFVAALALGSFGCKKKGGDQMAKMGEFKEAMCACKDGDK